MAGVIMTVGSTIYKIPTEVVEHILKKASVSMYPDEKKVRVYYSADVMDDIGRINVKPIIVNKSYFSNKEKCYQVSNSSLVNHPIFFYEEDIRKIIAQKYKVPLDSVSVFSPVEAIINKD